MRMVKLNVHQEEWLSESQNDAHKTPRFHPNFVGSTCHKSGSSPQRAESELCQKSGFQQTLTPLLSHRNGPMTIWTPLWHQKSDDFDSLLEPLES